MTDMKLGCINRYLISTEVSIGVQEAQEQLGPYLYPCVIEYSLMSMTVFYILWASIEQRYNIKNGLGGWLKTRTGSIIVPGSSTTGAGAVAHAGSGQVSSGGAAVVVGPTASTSGGHIEVTHSVGHCMNTLGRVPSKAHMYEKNPNLKTAIQNQLQQQQQQHHQLPQRRPSYRYSLSFEKRYANQFVIDCGKSTTGLFFGILTLLMTLISLITFFIYKGADKERAIKLSEVTELILISLSFVVNIVTIIKLKVVKFDHKISYSMGYNDTLTLIGLAGMYLFSFYSIIALLGGGLSDEIEKLSFSIQVLTLVEATTQAIFIINGLKMFTRDSRIRKSKPGRSFVTFLILINVSLWMSDTFSVKKFDMNRIQLDYYNVVFWSIVSSISAPLAIFYRFHASVCLSDMWKTLYE